MIEIRPVTDRRSVRQFIDLPYRKYRGHPQWIPPPRLTETAQFRASHPFFAVAEMALIMAWEGDRPVGRIAAIDDRRHNETCADNSAAFGFFEADSPEAAAALFAEVDRWAAAQGRTTVRGPVNPSLNYTAGLQLDAFDTEPFLMMPWNPPEYVGYVEAAGYTKAKDLFCWLLDLDHAPFDRLARLAARTERRLGVTVRSLNRWRFREEVDRIFEIYCRAWERNWGFAPPTRDEFWHTMKELRLLRMLRGVMIAEAGGRPIGCTTFVPDINQVLKGTTGSLLPFGWYRLLTMPRIVTRARAIATGVIPEYREQGVLAVIMHHAIAVAREYGFREAEFSWVLDDNTLANTTLAKGGARMYKTYRLYRNLSSEF